MGILRAGRQSECSRAIAFPGLWSPNPLSALSGRPNSYEGGTRAVPPDREWLRRRCPESRPPNAETRLGGQLFCATVLRTEHGGAETRLWSSADNQRLRRPGDDRHDPAGRDTYVYTTRQPPIPPVPRLR